jgi:hypothetical protein
VAAGRLATSADCLPGSAPRTAASSARAGQPADASGLASLTSGRRRSGVAVTFPNAPALGGTCAPLSGPNSDVGLLFATPSAEEQMPEVYEPGTLVPMMNGGYGSGPRSQQTVWIASPDGTMIRYSSSDPVALAAYTTPIRVI